MDKINPSSDMNGELIKLAVESANLGVWENNLLTHEVSWSNVMYNLIGIPLTEEVNHKTILEVIHPEDKDWVFKEISTCFKNDTPCSLDYRIIRKNDKRIAWMNFRGQVIKDADGKPYKFIGTGADISHMKAAELKATTADRAKTEFLANMSHEIRTPLNGIIGVCEILASHDLDPDDVYMLGIIQRSGNALLSIINDILDFSKIESGQLALYPEPFDLKDSLEDITSLLANAKRSSEIEVIVRYQPDLPKRFIGDGGRIRQILTNLVGNALKFTEVGNVFIEITDEVKQENARLRFIVRDTGIGIEDEKIEQIFDKFRQADNSTTRKYGGTGLGLTISKNFIEMMGGCLQVESEIGVGSTFSFSIDLPIDPSDAEPEKIRIINKPINILVVDDNEINRAILKEQLKIWGLKSALAASAKAGLSILTNAAKREIPIDLIILDYQMPDHDGIDFVNAVRHTGKFDHIPIILLSSVDGPYIVKQIDQLNIDKFLTKPPRGSILFDCICDLTVGRQINNFKEPCSASSLTDKTLKQKVSKEVNQDQVASRHDVLIAEDNDVNQMFAKRAMTELGFSYTIVENGKLAVDAWKRYRPKIILMDISMPEMDGYEATQTIRDIEKLKNLGHTPIIAVTAHAMSEDKARCLKHGMDDYLSKPLTMDKLGDCLNKWLLESADKKTA